MLLQKTKGALAVHGAIEGKVAVLCGATVARTRQWMVHMAMPIKCSTVKRSGSTLAAMASAHKASPVTASTGGSESSSSARTRTSPAGPGRAALCGDYSRDRDLSK